MIAAVNLTNAGCSRVERVKIVNHFGQPVRVRLADEFTSPIVPPQGEVVLDGRYYIGGGGIYVTILNAQGRILKDRVAVDIPGDSMFRSIAVVTVGP